MSVSMTNRERSIEIWKSNFAPNVDDMIQLFQNVLDVAVRGDNSDKREEVNGMPSTQHKH